MLADPGNPIHRPLDEVVHQWRERMAYLGRSRQPVFRAALWKLGHPRMMPVVPEL